MNWLSLLEGRAPLVKLPTGSVRIHVNHDPEEIAEVVKSTSVAGRFRVAAGLQPADEKKRERNRRYYAKNKHKVKRYVKKWRRLNPEKTREYSLKWESKGDNAARMAAIRAKKTAIYRASPCVCGCGQPKGTASKEGYRNRCWREMHGEKVRPANNPRGKNGKIGGGDAR